MVKSLLVVVKLEVNLFRSCKFWIHCAYSTAQGRTATRTYLLESITRFLDGMGVRSFAMKRGLLKEAHSVTFLQLIVLSLAEVLGRVISI